MLVESPAALPSKCFPPVRNGLRPPGFHCLPKRLFSSFSLLQSLWQTNRKARFVLHYQALQKHLPQYYKCIYDSHTDISHINISCVCVSYHETLIQVRFSKNFTQKRETKGKKKNKQTLRLNTHCSGAHLIDPMPWPEHLIVRMPNYRQQKNIEESMECLSLIVTEMNQNGW